MSDQIQKNRIAFIEHLYAEPEPDRSKSSVYSAKNCRTCLCAKGQFLKKFSRVLFDINKSTKTYDRPDSMGEGALDESVPEHMNPRKKLGITVSQWEEMEERYEGLYGLSGDHHKHSYNEIADWLQTLPGWPQVTINQGAAREDNELWLEEQLAFLEEKETHYE